MLGSLMASTEEGKKGCYHNLFKEILLEDTESFREFDRMDRNHFQFLVKRLWNHLYKKDTKMRRSITPYEKVSLFLQYLARGESFRSLEFTCRVSRRSIMEIWIISVEGNQCFFFFKVKFHFFIGSF